MIDKINKEMQHSMNTTVTVIVYYFSKNKPNILSQELYNILFPYVINIFWENLKIWFDWKFHKINRFSNILKLTNKYNFYPHLMKLKTRNMAMPRNQVFNYHHCR
jgi:hypothetical protein